jgi:hypothetical protein
VSTQPHRDQGYGFVGILAGLLCLLILGAGALVQGTGLPVEDMRQRHGATGLQVVVRDGRLSVDVQEADLGEVLAQIGRQANIRIVSGPRVGTRVSARFAGMEIEEGLRRLLRLASLSHLFRYAPGPSGKVVLAEVRVLGEEKTAPPPQDAPPPATIAKSVVPVHEPDPVTPGRKSRRQARTGSAKPVGSAEGEVAEPVPEIVEFVQEAIPDPVQEEPTEITRRIREVFSLGIQMRTRPPDDQASSPYEPRQYNHEPEGVGGTSR